MDILKGIFDPAKHISGAVGQLGGSAGSRGGRFGHLGEKDGSLGADQVSFKGTDYFDVNKFFNPANHFDPEKLLKRY